MRKSSLYGKKILLTGGDGFIGKNLVEKLIKTGAELTNIGNKGKISGIKNISADIAKTNFSFLDEFKFDYVIHLAGISSPKRAKNKKKTFDLNVNGTKKFFEKLYSKRIKKVIFLSSSLVYSESQVSLKENSPLNITSKENYARSKLLGEETCLDLMKKGLPILIFRLSNGYGPYQQWEKNATLVPQLISQSILEKKITLFNRETVRDYIHVGDITNAIVKGLTCPFSGTLNLGTGKGTSSETLAEKISYLTNSKIVYLDKEYSGPKKIILNISKTKKVLNWRPEININKGLKETIKYYNKVIKK